MKALSIRQPWAWMIVRPDVVDPEERGKLVARGDMKPVENRTWMTNYRGPILIHAGLREDKDGYYWIEDKLPGLAQEYRRDLTVTRGGIIGRANLVDCVSVHDSPWFFGPLGFVLEDVEPVPFHACKGRLGLFEIEYP